MTNPYEPPAPLEEAEPPRGEGLARDGETLSIRFEVSLVEVANRSIEQGLRAQRAARGFDLWWYGPILLLAGAPSMPWLNSPPGDSTWLNLAVQGWLLAVIYAFWYPWHQRRAYIQDVWRAIHEEEAAGLFAAPWQVVVAPDRLVIHYPHSTYAVDWRLVTAVERTEQHVRVAVGRDLEVAIPREAFAAPEEMEELAQAVRARLPP
jgi:hypothetical protein